MRELERLREIVPGDGPWTQSDVTKIIEHTLKLEDQLAAAQESAAQERDHALAAMLISERCHSDLAAAKAEIALLKNPIINFTEQQLDEAIAEVKEEDALRADLTEARAAIGVLEEAIHANLSGDETRFHLLNALAATASVREKAGGV